MWTAGRRRRPGLERLLQKSLVLKQAAKAAEEASQREAEKEEAEKEETEKSEEEASSDRAVTRATEVEERQEEVQEMLKEIELTRAVSKRRVPSDLCTTLADS